jgi:hypothetical protein
VWACVRVAACSPQLPTSKNTPRAGAEGRPAALGVTSSCFVTFDAGFWVLFDRNWANCHLCSLKGIRGFSLLCEGRSRAGPCCWGVASALAAMSKSVVHLEILETGCSLVPLVALAAQHLRDPAR